MIMYISMYLHRITYILLQNTLALIIFPNAFYNMK